MKHIYSAIIVAAVLLLSGCSSDPIVKTATLQCKVQDGKAATFYSFIEGVVSEHNQADLVFYFDGNDCSQGAIFGRNDNEGYIFPVGQKSWGELSLTKVPQKETKSIAWITPLTKDKEGTAYWVKTQNEQYILVRIKSVQSASFSDLVSGDTATVELEWSPARI